MNLIALSHKRAIEAAQRAYRNAPKGERQRRLKALRKVVAECLKREVAVIALCLLATPAFGHGEYSWIMGERTAAGATYWTDEFKSATGVPCCGLTDCHPVEIRDVKTDGADWIFPSPVSGNKLRVPVGTEHPSLDRQGRFYVCLSSPDTVRCFFVPMSG